MSWVMGLRRLAALFMSSCCAKIFSISVVCAAFLFSAEQLWQILSLCLTVARVCSERVMTQKSPLQVYGSFRFRFRFVLDVCVTFARLVVAARVRLACLVVVLVSSIFLLRSCRVMARARLAALCISVAISGNKWLRGSRSVGRVPQRFHIEVRAA